MDDDDDDDDDNNNNLYSVSYEEKTLSSPSVLPACGHTALLKNSGAGGGVVVKALRYKPAGRGFDSRRCHLNFSVT